MRIMAIDPGNCSGWAVVDGGKLVHCGFMMEPQTIGQGNFDLVIVEKPRVYRSRLQKGDPNDLINLAVLVGQFVAYAKMALTDYELVTPAEWKGQTPKKVNHYRILKALDKHERSYLDSALSVLAASLHHNVLDAVGIAKWRAA